MFDQSTWSGGEAAELPFEACQTIIDQFIALCGQLGAITEIEFVPRFILSGGDPMLHPAFWQILSHIDRRGYPSMILGNADLLDAHTGARLFDLGVRDFQLSLDGLELTHDEIRGVGSFRTTLEGVALLRCAGIAPHLMATIFRKNMTELPDLIMAAASSRASSFSFARATSFGNAQQLDLAISPQEFRATLLTAHRTQERLVQDGVETRFPRKDHLWTLLLHELGELQIYPHLHPGKAVDGCHMGQTFLVMLADGTALACRRFHSPVGRFPEQSLAEIFLRSPQLAQYRRVHGLEKCSQCRLLFFCRGCPAVAHGHHGEWSKPDPQCWKTI